MDNRAYEQHGRPRDLQAVPQSSTSNRQNPGTYSNPAYQNKGDRGGSRDVRPDEGQNSQPQAPTRTKRQAPGAPAINQPVNGSSQVQDNRKYEQQNGASLQQQRPGQVIEGLYQNGHQNRLSQQPRDQPRPPQEHRDHPRPSQQPRDQPRDQPWPPQEPRDQPSPPQEQRDQPRPSQQYRDQLAASVNQKRDLPDMKNGQDYGNQDRQHKMNPQNSSYTANPTHSQQNMLYANDHNKSNQYTPNNPKEQPRNRNQDPPHDSSQTNFGQNIKNVDQQRTNHQDMQNRISQQNTHEHRQQPSNSQQNMQYDKGQSRTSQHNPVQVPQGQAQQQSYKPNQQEMVIQNNKNERQGKMAPNGMEPINRQPQTTRSSSNGRPVDVTDDYRTTTRGNFHDNLGLAVSSENLTRGMSLQPHLSSAKSMDNVSYANQMSQPGMTHARSVQNLMPSPKYAVQDLSPTGIDVEEGQSRDDGTSEPPGGNNLFRKKKNANKNSQAPVNRVSRNLQHAQSLPSLHDPQGGNLLRANSAMSINMVPIYRTQSTTSLSAVSISSIHTGALHRAYSRNSLAMLDGMDIDPDDYFPFALLSCLFCFFPIGIAAILESIWTRQAIREHRLDLARTNSSMTRFLIILSVCFGSFIWLVGVCVGIYMLIATS